MEKKTVLKIAIVLVIFAVGFFSGMEYKAYQIRSAIGDAFSETFGSSEKTKEETKSVDSEKEDRPAVSNDLTKKIGFEITSKSFAEGDFTSYNVFTFQITNKTSKDIAGIKGFVNLKDMFGDQITRINFSYDEGVKATESKLYRASVDYNPFIEVDKQIRQTELSKLKYDWDVETIIYVDGTEESY